MIASDIKDALLNLGKGKKPHVQRVSELIPIPKNVRRFVDQAIGSLFSEAKTLKVFVECKNRDGFILHGPSNIITEWKQKINDIVYDIQQKIVTHRLQLSSVESDLFRANAYKLAKNIEHETNTVIIDVKVFMDSSKATTHSNNDDDSGLTIAYVANNRDQTILVMKGDITKVKNVDAIVNAANGPLYHAGGIDKMIADAAGPALDQECKQLIAQNDGSPFAAGQAVKTTAGNLPFKCVIHAIGPQYIDGNQQERPLLFASILSSLRLAEDEGCRSLALPAISSNTYGFPMVDCTNIIVRAVKQFFADFPQSKMKKIILCDLNEAICNSFAREVTMDHRNLFDEDADIFNYDLPALTAIWRWKDLDGERLYTEHDTRQIEHAFQNYLRTSNLPSNLVISADNLKSGSIVQYSIHFLPELQQMLQNDPNALKSGLVCGYQMRKDTRYRRNIIRYPVTETVRSKSVGYTFKPLDLYSLKVMTDYDDWDIIGISNTSTTKAEKAIRQAIDDATISEQYSINLDKNLDKHRESIKSLAAQQEIQITFQEECLGQLSMVLKGFKPNVQDAKLKIASYANDILKTQVEKDDELQIPKEWGDQTKDLVLVEIPKNDSSFVRIENRMKETLNNVKIHKIERVQNVRMWSHYAFRRQQLKQDLRHKPSIQVEMELFHGTRNAPPSEIYTGEYGFDMTFCTNGMWGRGTYFAKNASYSCANYAYKLPNGNQQVFLAQVLTGDVFDCPSDSSLCRPPKKNEKVSGLRYNSVSGDTGGSKVYIVYENRVAYPTYLITFTL